MTRIAHDERLALCDLLEELGPDAPTLDDPWLTRDLAAHLVVRERHPSVLGVRVKALAGWTEHTQRSYARRPYHELVAMVRTGPPFWSPFSLPPVDGFLNTTEYYVHHEDVRRAQPEWSPRTLHAKVEDALWRIVQGRARLAFRHARTGVRLVRETGEAYQAKSGEPAVTLTGGPQELLLYVFGRTEHARVDVGGDAAARSAFRGTDLQV